MKRPWKSSYYFERHHDQQVNIEQAEHKKKQAEKKVLQFKQLTSNTDPKDDKSSEI